jgi:LmbE family N-acetylglucosaminyl deacetylase
MSDDSKNDVTIRRERRLEEFLDNEENDNGNWSPPAKVKKAELKKKKAELVLKKDRVTEAFIDQLQEKVLIWSKVDPSHIDHMKMGKAWEEVLANLLDQFARKVLEEAGFGNTTQLKAKFRSLKDNFNRQDNVPLLSLGSVKVISVII